MLGTINELYRQSKLQGTCYDSQFSLVATYGLPLFWVERLTINDFVNSKKESTSSMRPSTTMPPGSSPMKGNTVELATIEALRLTFVALKHAAVFSVRAEAWVQLQNVARLLLNYVPMAALVLGLQCQLPRVLGKQFILNVVVIAESLLQMLKKGCANGWFKGVRPARDGSSELESDPIFDDTSFIHIDTVLSTICLTLLLLREYGSWQHLLSLGAMFNDITDDRFAQMTLPTMVYAASKMNTPSKVLLPSLETLMARVQQLAMERSPAMVATPGPAIFWFVIWLVSTPRWRMAKRMSLLQIFWGVRWYLLTARLCYF